MKLSKKIIFSVFVLFYFFAIGQEKCTFEQVKKTFMLENLRYQRCTKHINLENALRYNKTDFLGFIGENKKRLKIVLLSVNQDKKNSQKYLIKGFSTVLNKNKRFFEGIFFVENSFLFSELPFESSVDDLYGFSILTYQLYEDKELTATGIFEGKIIVSWKKKQNIIEYEDIFDGYDGCRNYQFIGTWTSYKTGKSQECNWGQRRIPCSGDLDIGVAEFMPNEKYRKYGWGDYVP